MLLALLFIILGVIFLLKNLGVVNTGVWELIWPIFLILVGVWIFWKKYEWEKWKERIWRKLE